MIMAKELYGTISKQTSLSKPSGRLKLGIQEVVSPEASNLDHSVKNKKQGDQIQFSPEKDCRKKKMDSLLLLTHHSGRWIVF